MFCGVMGFYFVLSNINAVLSSAIREDVQFAARLSMLERLHKKYTLDAPTYKRAKMSLYEQETNSARVNLEPFLSNFPSLLRGHLKFHWNAHKLSQFGLFSGLGRALVKTLGNTFQELRIGPSTCLTRQDNFQQGPVGRSRLLCHFRQCFDGLGRILWSPRGRVFTRRRFR